MRSSADKWDIPFQPTSKKRQAGVCLLDSDQPVSREMLAEHADLPKSTVTEVINDLVNAGFDVRRTTDARRMAWFQVVPKGAPLAQGWQRVPRRASAPELPLTQTPKTKAAGEILAGAVVPEIDRTAEAETVGAAALSVAVANAPAVKFKGYSDGVVSVSWEGAPGVLFTGTVGDSVPGALFSGDSQVVGLQVHPSGVVVLDLGFMQVRGSLR